MIKRIAFAGAGSSTEGRPVRWSSRAEAASDAPDDIRPLRITWCTALTDIGSQPEHAGLGLEWFGDEAHLDRFDAWVAGVAPDDGVDPVILAAEHIMRGDEWLDRRWSGDRSTFKHVAVARRAVGLTPAQFSETWRTGAGRVQRASDQPALVIPDDVRGCAYVQNHPLPRADGEWAYDAVNEVSFDDLDGLRRRVDWFAEHVGAGAEPDLISANGFLALTEVVVLPGR